MHEMDLWKSWHRDEPRQAEQKVGLGVVVRDLLHDGAVLGTMVEEVLRVDEVPAEIGDGDAWESCNTPHHLRQ